MPEQQAAPYRLDLDIFANGQRLGAGNYRDPSYDRQPAPQFVNRGMGSFGIFSIAAACCIVAVVIVLALTDNLVFNDAAARRVDARIEADRAVRLASANIEPLRIKADVVKTLAQTNATVEIAKANVTGTTDPLAVVNHMITGPVQRTPWRREFTNAAYTVPAVHGVSYGPSVRRFIPPGSGRVTINRQFDAGQEYCDSAGLGGTFVSWIGSGHSRTAHCE